MLEHKEVPCESGEKRASAKIITREARFAIRLAHFSFRSRVSFHGAESEFTNSHLFGALAIAFAIGPGECDSALRYTRATTTPSHSPYRETRARRLVCEKKERDRAPRARSIDILWCSDKEGLRISGGEIKEQRDRVVARTRERVDSSRRDRFVSGRDDADLL